MDQGKVEGGWDSFEVMLMCSRGHQQAIGEELPPKHEDARYFDGLTIEET